MHVDSGAGEALRDLCELSGPIQELEVQDVVELVLQARIRQGLLRRLNVRGHDAEEGDIVFRFARDRPDVHGPVRKGLRHARQLPGFVGYEHLELLRSPPPSSSAEESAGPLQKASPPVRERQGTSRTRSRGNRIASRMFGRSRSFWTNRSSPNPQPPCGGMP